MLRIAICDDDPAFLQKSLDALRRWPGPENRVTEAFSDGDALLQAHSAAPFDIILLDVVMPLLSGLETAAELRQHDRRTKIVFLTSSPEYALESYAVKASNYLLKPLRPEPLYRCLDELAEELQQTARCITVKSTNAIHRVEAGRIEYIEAQNKHVLFALTDGEQLLAAEPLYTYESQLLLADGFFKCSRSYMVNLHRIATYTAKEITMRSGARIPISRGCHKSFEEAYFSLLFGKAGEE